MPFFSKVQSGIEGLFGGGEKHSHTHMGAEDCSQHHLDEHVVNRYHSFAAPSHGRAKYYVDGASYFWAVAEALKEAQESIYILDWWLTPELYLRRPPSRNEPFRLDNMLKAAAERGVSVNIIVYKEVPQALTLDSEHTKHALEALHPNIKVFRHPDHHPTGYDLEADLKARFSSLSFGNLNFAKMPEDALKTIYGQGNESITLFWSHHEKLVLVDRKTAFMGGLDLCFGRWDTHTHPIADAHPGNLDEIIFPGQDFNNARIYDFVDVNDWKQNKLDRTKSSRMGWSDISISLSGPVVDSLQLHFTDRWNYIFHQKYKSKDGEKYKLLEYLPHESHHRMLETALGEHQFREHHRPSHLFGDLGERFNRHVGHMFDPGNEGEPESNRGGVAAVQITRSCSDWSAGHKTEHSIANAYIDVINKSEHFIYIENQFFITATDDAQRPVGNKIGAALVNRIERAHYEGKPFRVVVVMPAVPAFAGDLQADDALGTRAVMEFQYFSICRGEHSILEALGKKGIDARRYIGFYNLRNYDRINTSDTMAEAEQKAGPGVDYEAARKEHDDAVGAGYPESSGYGTTGGDLYQRYQAATARTADLTWDTVAAAYMASGPKLDSLSWHGPAEAELDAFVSEELYVHSKVLIADDRVVVCGSANLNDRSQLGDHDSEIAAVIEDPTPVETEMAGQSFVAARFASALRRTLFRKHLGLLPHQKPDGPDNDADAVNWLPVGDGTAGINAYDFGSAADRLVRDPLSDEFVRLWDDTAKTNTDVFSRAFHCVPNDRVKTWDEYNDFFAKHFIIPGAAAAGKDGKEDDKKDDKKDDGAAAAAAAADADNKGKVEYGHVVRDEFPGGVAELKEWLGKVRGTLVEMPLQFLAGVDDIAKEGLSLNALTEELYT